ncbi:MAG: RNA methyltransferase [Bacteroidota bacterium]|nr:RNA methyltransferase [Bacteroidota bacterium]|tara:strand:+ start:763 stop:1290 length:528 start_codon:yes stop_codon:yes gene_type:complete
MRKLKNSELNRLSIEEFKNSKKTPISIILDDIRSLNNIGSVFRTADAFLIDTIYLCGITAKPPNKDIHKTALGSTDSVNWEYHKNIVDLINSLKKNGLKIVSVEQAENSVPLNNFIYEENKKYAFIFGNEVNGVSQKAIDICDKVIEIPQYGTKHSFNISVSIGIVLWDVYNKIN